MDIQEMKSNWHSAKDSINTVSELQLDENRKTALQRLGDKYNRFSHMSLVIMLCGPLVLWNVGIRSVLLFVGYYILTGAASIFDAYLAQSIRAINLTRMPVTEVLERTMRCRKLHLRWEIYVLPIVVLWVAATAYTMQADIYFVYGVITGGFIGLVMGIRVLLRFLNDYREVMQE